MKTWHAPELIGLSGFKNWIVSGRTTLVTWGAIIDRQIYP